MYRPAHALLYPCVHACVCVTCVHTHRCMHSWHVPRGIRRRRQARGKPLYIPDIKPNVHTRACARARACACVHAHTRTSAQTCEIAYVCGTFLWHVRLRVCMAYMAGCCKAAAGRQTRLWTGQSAFWHFVEPGPKRVTDMCINMCMCMCICMCIGMCIDMHVGMCIGMCIGMHIGVCIGMCIGICIGMCIGMRIGMCMACA